MRRLVAHWRYLFPAAWRLCGAYFQAMIFWKFRAKAILPLPPGRSLVPREYRRWRHYFLGATFLAAVFCQLRRQGLSRAERRRFAVMAALASMFDDYADLIRSKEGAGVNDLEKFGQNLDDGGLSLYLLRKMYASVPPGNLDTFKTALNRVFKLETSNREIKTQPELEKRASEKGGNSVLAFRCLLEHMLTGSEQRLALEFGGFVQLCDDCFDVWFDRQNNITTPARLLLEQQGPEHLISFFEQQWNAAVHAVRQLPVPRYRRETTLRAFCFLAGITRVCLYRYRFLKKKHGTLPLHSRRAMVVDMERWGNRGRAFWKIVTDKL